MTDSDYDEEKKNMTDFHYGSMRNDTEVFVKPMFEWIVSD